MRIPWVKRQKSKFSQMFDWVNLYYVLGHNLELTWKIPLVKSDIVESDEGRKENM